MLFQNAYPYSAFLNKHILFIEPMQCYEAMLPKNLEKFWNHLRMACHDESCFHLLRNCAVNILFFAITKESWADMAIAILSVTDVTQDLRKCCHMTESLPVDINVTFTAFKVSNFWRNFPSSDFWRDLFKGKWLLMVAHEYIKNLVHCTDLAAFPSALTVKNFATFIFAGRKNTNDRKAMH